MNLKTLFDEIVSNNNNPSLLHIASANDHLSIAQFLIENGANVNQLDNKGRSALWIANAFGHIEIVEYLKSKGAKE